MVENKRENISFSPSLSSLCSRKVLRPDVNYLVRGEGSFIQNHNWGQRLSSWPCAFRPQAQPETLFYPSPGTWWALGEAEPQPQKRRLGACGSWQLPLDYL